MALLEKFSALVPEFNDAQRPEKVTVTEQNTLRIVVGILGILLPVILWLGLFCVSGFEKPLESISHYYYTRVNTAFSVTIGLLAIFLLIYKGKRPADFILSALAGLFAFCVIFFPTTNLSPQCYDKEHPYAITYINPENIHATFHFISAGIFLSCLAMMSLFRFPKNNSSDEIPTSLDKFMYRLCGIIMLLAMLVIFLGNFGILLDKKYFEPPYCGTFWGEAVAVWAFGYSWLLKAGFFTKVLRLL